MFKLIGLVGSLICVFIMGIAPLSSQAYSNTPSFSSPVPNFPRNETVPCIHAQTLKHLLQKLAEQTFSQEVQATFILSYVDAVLEDGILEDPQAYLEAWAKNRGITREYRMPEDAALSFFKYYLQNPL